MTKNIIPLTCIICSKVLVGKQTKFCSNKCHTVDSNSRHQSYLKQQDRAILRKAEAIRIKGGKCQLCGYSNNMAALEFHHRNPLEKKFGLDARRLSNRKWEYILKELEKCDLLCSNCHSEVHCSDEKFKLNNGLGPPGDDPRSDKL